MQYRPYDAYFYNNNYKLTHTTEKYFAISLMTLCLFSTDECNRCRLPHWRNSTSISSSILCNVAVSSQLSIYGTQWNNHNIIVLFKSGVRLYISTLSPTHTGIRIYQCQCQSKVKYKLLCKHSNHKIWKYEIWWIEKSNFLVYSLVQWWLVGKGEYNWVINFLTNSSNPHYLQARVVYCRDWNLAFKQMVQNFKGLAFYKIAG